MKKIFKTIGYWFTYMLIYGNDPGWKGIYYGSKVTKEKLNLNSIDTWYDNTQPPDFLTISFKVFRYRVMYGSDSLQFKIALYEKGLKNIDKCSGVINIMKPHAYIKRNPEYLITLRARYLQTLNEFKNELKNEYKLCQQ